MKNLLIADRGATFTRLSAVSLFSACILISGCGDSMIIGWQPVQFKVSNISDGESVACANLVISHIPNLKLWHGSDKDYIAHFAKNVTTGPDGIASVNLSIRIIRGGLIPGIIPGPNYSRDRVTNRSYLATIRGNLAEETIRIKMNIDQPVDGEVYRLTVLDIGKPYFRR